MIGVALSGFLKLILGLIAVSSVIPLLGLLSSGHREALANEAKEVDMRVQRVGEDVIQVLLLGSEKFDPRAEVRPNKVRLGPSGARPFLVFPKRRHSFGFDLNQDGHGDLVLWFKTKKSGFETGELIGCVEGQLRDGGTFERCEQIGQGALATVPCTISLRSDTWVAQCTYTESQYPLSMNSLIEAINEETQSVGLAVTDTSALWIEARGGNGGRGGNSGGKGGAGGYARTGIEVGELKNGLLPDGDSLFLLIGEKGETTFLGSSGGASSIVIGQDLLDIKVGELNDPDAARVLIIAAGGGGGGGGDTRRKSGGSGAAAIGLGVRDSVEGGKGQGVQSGRGGNADDQGSGGTGFGNGASGIGGFSGKGEGERVGWGIEIEWTAGRGGDVNRDNMRGGAGGGGFGGGGAARDCQDEFLQVCGNGGGAGGGWARHGTVENRTGPFLGPDNLPVNEGAGVVLLTLELLDTD